MTEQHEEDDELFFDDFWNSYDYCYECAGYGDDYSSLSITQKGIGVGH